MIKFIFTMNIGFVCLTYCIVTGAEWWKYLIAMLLIIAGAIGAESKFYEWISGMQKTIFDNTNRIDELEKKNRKRR